MHSHGHGHSHGTGSILQWSLLATSVFVVVELVAGIQAHSLALLSDAGHNFTDALAILLAWVGFRLQSKPADDVKTYGYHRASVLAAFVNALTLVVLFPFAYIAGGVRLEALAWATLAVRVLLGSLPFIAAGFAIGYLSGPNSAVAVINLIYLPTAFASGLFFPKQLLPQFIQTISPYLPLHFFGQLGWDAVGAPTDGSVTTDWLYLIGYGVVFFAIAVWAYRREESRKFS